MPIIIKFPPAAVSGSGLSLCGFSDVHQFAFLLHPPPVTFGCNAGTSTGQWPEG